jgi:NitT/TauT family transport system ATP-binding protein
MPMPEQFPKGLSTTESAPDSQPDGLCIEDLSVSFDETHFTLDSLDLQVQPGEIIALVGASGCGKSTLLRAIAGLQSFQRGTIQFVGSHGRRSGNLSFVFQDATLLPWRSAYENVSLPLELLGKANSSATVLDSWDDRITAALMSVELSPDTWRKFPRQLSGGMRMRVSIARSLVTDPDIMLLDEPFAALDDLLRTKLNELILNLWNVRKRTILFVTHNIAEAVFLSHKIAVFGKGSICRLMENSLPWPRAVEHRSRLEFAKLYGEVSQALAEVNQ